MKWTRYALSYLAGAVIGLGMGLAFLLDGNTVSAYILGSLGGFYAVRALCIARREARKAAQQPPATE